MKKTIALLMILCMTLGCLSFASAEEKVYQIGILQLGQHNALDAATQGFKDALTEAFGDNVQFDEQNANFDVATCSTIATTFANNNYDLILANATPALQACVSATDTIPIIGTSVTDYGEALTMPELDVTVGTGINVAGSSDGVDGKLYADMVMELVPEAQNVSILYCSAEPNSVVQAASFIAAMPDGVKCTEYTFADSNDLQSVATVAADGADAIYIPTDNTAAANMTIISNITEPQNIPVICGEENMMLSGGMATVSISYYAVGRLAGEQAVQVLNGTEVGTLPIAYLTNAVKEYNPDYVAEIGFEIPADYVIPEIYEGEAQ